MQVYALYKLKIKKMPYQAEVQKMINKYYNGKSFGAIHLRMWIAIEAQLNYFVDFNRIRKWYSVNS